MSRQCHVQPRTYIASRTPSVVLPRARHVSRVRNCEFRRAVHAVHGSFGARERALGLAKSNREHDWRLPVFSGSSGSDQSESSHQGSEKMSPNSGLESIGGLHSRSRRLSMQQKMRALWFRLEELKAKAASLPPFASIISLLAALKVQMKPLFDLLEDLESKKQDLIETYEQYLAEETKLRWNWEKKNQKEIALLRSIPPYIFGVLCTLAYEVFIPVSLVFALLLPLYYSWVMWDRWWLSPVFLGLVLISPLKFVPRALSCSCWIWPGIL